MADLPAHPETDDGGAGPDPASATGGSRRRAIAGIAVAVVLVVVFAVLHLTGVLGPAVH